MALLDTKDAVFRETRWTLVLTAAGRDSAAGEEALAKLCQDYWRPLFFFIRRKHYKPEDAEDLCQTFFELLLSKNFLEQADRARGRFRTFLLTAVDHFLSNQAKANRVIKRGGKFTFVSLDAAEAEAAYQRAAMDNWTPEKVFEKQWAISIMEKAKTKLQDEYSRAKKAAHFQVLQVFLSHETEAGFCGLLAEKLGISAASLRVAVHRMRRRYHELMRQEVAETVQSPAEVDDELRHLRAVVSEL